MQRSSESIGTLAAALAKAQAELINPEKSLVATIRSDLPGGAERVFRYASLSSGLDIVRKVLGQHEIATVQTTSVDQAAGIINLTTMLAHASGEWIASDWPVCAVSETETPQRMGAALTYARRYALFTLVGIAGEDDVDAPDLAAPPNRTIGPEKIDGNPNRQLNGGQRVAPQRNAGRRDAAVPSRSPTATLAAEASAELRDQLIAELNDLGSGDDAALWAHRCLPEKNRLNAADAQRVEEAFQTRLVAVAADHDDLPATGQVGPATPNRQRAEKSKNQTRSSTVDKTGLTMAGAAPGSRSGSCQSRSQALLSDLRPATCRRPPPPIRSEPGARPQGQRRVYRPVMQGPPSRGPPLWRRSGMVEKRRD